MYYSRLKAIRTAKGMTLEQLSELTNISVRLFVPFRKWNSKKSFNRGNGKNC